RQAVNTWSSFSARFPESEHKPEVEKLLKKARDRLAKKEMVIAAFYEQRKAPLAVQGRILGMLQRYPDSPDVPRALVMLGLSYMQTNQPDMAQAVLKRLEEDYPAYAGVLKLRRVLVVPAESPAPAATPTTAPAPTR
ncbi:MAG TPA: outer membrane protein assembly factor BamD, partial [Myxococcota bacterium]|nr:outer membrane protein assembly factor BamD [Myxococcota bacterium]